MTSLENTLSDILESAERDSKRLGELNVGQLDDEADLLLRERLGLLSQRAALLTKAETKIATLELMAKVTKRPQ